MVDICQDKRSQTERAQIKSKTQMANILFYFFGRCYDDHIFGKLRFENHLSYPYYIIKKHDTCYLKHCGHQTCEIAFLIGAIFSFSTSIVELK